MTITAEAPVDQEEPPLRLPSLPDEPPPPGFPVLMTVAPVVVSLILFALLRTPYVLMFAILGPVLGTANVIDSRIGRKRRRRRAVSSFDIEANEARREISEAHRRLRARARNCHPMASDLVDGARRTESGIVVGLTSVRSGLRLEGAGSDDRSRELVHLASRLDGAPLVSDACRLRVEGPRPEVVGSVRALVVQVLTDRLEARLALCGERSRVVAAELGRWGVELVDTEGAEVCICAHSAVDERNSASCEDPSSVSIAIQPGGEATFTDSSGRQTRMTPDSIGAAQLAQFAPRIVAAQRARASLGTAIPSSCDLGDVATDQSENLAVAFLVGARGDRGIDLVSHGPHAVIGGTTGSGKSELLIAWTAALARSYSSDEVNFLCLDFKGGATFDAIARLPHCVGVVTDLDDDEAVRVGASLRAEVRRREQSLRELGARDIADLQPGLLPRLVVLVDEFQALIETHPDLQELFGDLGARGRSLGIHLILCTQRPTGTFRENLLANSAIRICLRVEQVSDSMTLLASAEGAHLDRDIRGRACLRIGGGELEEVQVAMARPGLIEEVAAREAARRRHGGLDRVRRPWHRPLPNLLELDLLPPKQIPGCIPYALADLPERQQQPVISLDHPGHHLFVVGMARSGKTGVIQTIGESAVRMGVRVARVGASVEHAWDTVERFLRMPPSTWTVLLIDDIDMLEQQLDDEHRVELLDRVQRLLRTASRRNISVVLTARRVSGALQRLRGLCSDSLCLSAPSRQEWILQGGEPADWNDRMPPGRGRLGRLLVQVAMSEATVPQGQSVEWSPFGVPNGGLLVTGRRLRPVRQSLIKLGHECGEVPSGTALRAGELEGDFRGQVLVGEVDQWNAAYGALPKLAEQMPVLAVGLTAGEWRSTFRGDPIHPVLEDSFSRAILRMPDGSVARVELSDGGPVRVERRTTGRITTGR